MVTKHQSIRGKTYNSYQEMIDELSEVSHDKTHPEYDYAKKTLESLWLSFLKGMKTWGDKKEKVTLPKKFVKEKVVFT